MPLPPDPRTQDYSDVKPSDLDRKSNGGVWKYLLLGCLGITFIMVLLAAIGSYFAYHYLTLDTHIITETTPYDSGQHATDPDESQPQPVIVDQSRPDDAPIQEPVSP